MLAVGPRKCLPRQIKAESGGKRGEVNEGREEEDDGSWSLVEGACQG